jgi:hypothetical protein
LAPLKPASWYTPTICQPAFAVTSSNAIRWFSVVCPSVETRRYIAARLRMAAPLIEAAAYQRTCSQTNSFMIDKFEVVCARISASSGSRFAAGFLSVSRRGR